MGIISLLLINLSKVSWKAQNIIRNILIKKVKNLMASTLKIL